MTQAHGSIIIPSLRYRNANAAIEWLCEAFGFERHLVVPGEDGSIAHSQLKLKNSMIMVGSATPGGEFDQIQKPMAGMDATVTQSAYVIVDDVDAHHDRAVKHGARVVIALYDADYGGRGYSCRDLEGHLWNFGDYNPWAASGD